MRLTTWNLGASAALLSLSLFACPDGSDETDAATATDAGGGQPDAAARDTSSPPVDSGGSDLALPDAGGGDSWQPDAAVNFTREVTIGYDDGLPAIRLLAEPLAQGRLFVEPAENLLPVEVRRIRFMPCSTYTATLRIASDSFFSPGSTLAEQEFTVGAADVDTWFEIDLSDLHVQVDDPFWVVLDYAASLTGAQEVMYGGTSSSGNNVYFKPGWNPYTVNFDQLMRVVVATPNSDSPPATLPDGEPCAVATECSNGFCSGARCTSGCLGGDCGSGRTCRTFASGDQICVTDCTAEGGECPDDAFCLVDPSFLDPAEFCVLGGPFADGEDCIDHYHTICASGHCSACDSDPTQCADPGTCGG